MIPFTLLLNLVAAAFAKAGGEFLAERVSRLVSKAAKGDDYKKSDVAIRLLIDAASGSPERLDKMAAEARRQMTSYESDR